MSLSQRNPLLNHRPPRRFGIRRGEERLPIGDGRRELPVLLLGDGEQDARLDQSRIEVVRLLQGLAGFLCHNPVIGEHQRLTLPGEPLRRRAEQPDRLAIGFGRIAVCEGWRRGAEVAQVEDPATAGAHVREMIATVRKNSGMDGLELD